MTKARVRYCADGLWRVRDCPHGFEEFDEAWVFSEILKNADQIGGHVSPIAYPILLIGAHTIFCEAKSTRAICEQYAPTRV